MAVLLPDSVRGWSRDGEKKAGVGEERDDRGARRTDGGKERNS